MRARIILASAICLAVLIGGVAYANIPHSTTGVITGCYKNSHPAKGAVIVVDAQYGEVCPSGYVEFTWNQTGPQGPPGVSGYEIVSGTFPSNGIGDTTSNTMFCPFENPEDGTGRAKKVLGGGWSTQGDVAQEGLAIRSSQPDTANPPNRYGWSVTYENIDIVPANDVITIYAVCAFADESS